LKGWHKNVKVNSNGKGGIKVGSLGFLEIFKAKWHWNNLHKLYIIKEKKIQDQKGEGTQRVDCHGKCHGGVKVV